MHDIREAISRLIMMSRITRGREALMIAAEREETREKIRSRVEVMLRRGKHPFDRISDAVDRVLLEDAAESFADLEAELG